VILLNIPIFTYLSSENKTLELLSLLCAILNLNRYYMALKTFRYISRLLLNRHKELPDNKS
jgi:hypothetical protein